MKSFISIISMLFLSCAAQAPATGGPQDNTGPEIINVSPIDAMTHIDVDAKIIFEFDQNNDAIKCIFRWTHRFFGYA